GAGSFITPPQLCQNLSPGCLIHIFIHSGHGNPTFGTTYPLTALLSPTRVTILLAQFATVLFANEQLRLGRARLCSSTLLFRDLPGFGCVCLRGRRETDARCPRYWQRKRPELKQTNQSKQPLKS
ncbi:MAG: hypothetical protein NTW03_07705, partial [Verrucomicrobia bacterium]|nr:hypothetical protein [Verrucomicrobiota bacterium]